MKKLVLISSLILLLTPLKHVLALDKACEPFVKATQLKIEQPAWYDITDAPDMKMELLKIDRKSFIRKNNGKWEHIPG
ncbi:MAG: hypothetical protein ABL925_19685, partial [Methylococcales bacterium]